MTKPRFFYKKGELANGDWDVIVNNKLPGWKHTGTRVATLSPGKSLEIAADKVERLIWQLEGEGIVIDYVVNGESKNQKLTGRKTVFSGPADVLYLSIDTSIKISGSGRFIVAEAPAKNSFPDKYIPAKSVPVLSRGAGPASRQVHNFGDPSELAADRLIVVEIIVPAGNWSGSPAHKHDTYIPGVESNLEEIYYFEAAVSKNLPAQESADPVGFFQGRASDEREFELTTEVRSGEVILVPHGWHGPVMAQPGYDLYFMNVMAGPDPDRSWNITDDPAQGWIRKTWNEKDIDPRLPYLNN